MSAPAPDIYKRLGISADGINELGTKVLAFFAGKQVAPVPVNGHRW